MASNGYILDIDTKFIQNLERADKALRQSVNAANDLTDRFTQMVNSTSNYSLGVQNVLNVLNKLKGVQIDPATGLLKMGTEARNTAEGIELLKTRTEDLKARWVSLSKEIGKKKKGPAAMQIVNEKDLTNINALQTAIANINDILSSASGNKKIGLKTQQQLIEQRKLYSDLLKEAQLTDAQRLESEIKLTNGVITEANKRAEAVIKEKKREVTEAIKLANTANVRNPGQVSNARSAIASARQGLDPSINAEQAQIQSLNIALEKLNERYKAVHETKVQTQKEIFSEAKTARDLANTARGYEEIQRAIKAIEEVKTKINPDTKRGQAELQRLARAYERMYERASKAASISENERYQLALMAMSKTQKAQEAAKAQEEKRLKDTEARITKTHADELARRDADEKANYQMALVTMAARQRAQENAEKLKADNLIAMEMRITQAVIDEENKRAQVQQAHQANANAKSSISSYVKGRNASTATESDYARMFDEQARKQAEEQYKQAMAMAQTARSATELRTAIAAIETAQRGFNNSTGDGAKRLAALENAHRKLTDALAIENGELTTTQARNVSNALAYAQNAQGVMQLTIAYARLRSAAKDINPSTEAGQQALHQLELKAKDVKNQLDGISKPADGLNKSLAKVGSHIKTAFGLNAIKNFVSKLIRIHGEFEKINVSLKVLVGSTARAEIMWERITKLALKSPFTVQQLSTSIKQMAAYRVESDKLYSSTKMLADISAGLGVEMSRLILAYGQVKAANFLRGTELRQFSEAGIDMLGQLASYYSEIENKVVSTGEVFDRISKRMVMFEDVEAVLERVTGKGGAFYEMQEKQSQTLAGQVSNLKDAIQLMFHGIGESTHGILLSTVKAVKTIIDNWQKWLPILSAVISGLITAKAVSMGFTALAPVFRILNLVLFSTRARVILLRNAWLALQAVTPMGWATLAISAIASIGVAAATYSKSAESVEETNDELAVSGEGLSGIFHEQANALKTLGEKIVAYTSLINSLTKSQEEMEKGSEEYVETSNLINEAMASRSSAVSELTAKYGELAGKIGDVINNEEELIAFLNGEITHNSQQEVLSDMFEKIDSNLFDNMAKSFDKLVVEVNRAGLDWDFLNSNEFNSEVDDMVKSFTEKVGRLDNSIQSALSSSSAAAMYSSTASLSYADEYTSAVSAKSNYLNSEKALVGQSAQQYAQYREQLNSDITAIINEWGRLNNIDISAMTEEQTDKFFKDFSEIISAMDILPEKANTLKRAISDVINIEWRDPAPDLLPWQERYNSYIAAYAESLGLTVEGFASLDSAFGQIKSESLTDKNVIEQLDARIAYFEQVITAFEGYSEAQRASSVMLYTQADYDNAKANLPKAQHLRSFYPASTGGGRGKTKNDYIGDAAKGIRELHKAYKDMQKTMGDGTANAGAWERYGKGVKESLKNAKINVDTFLATVGDLTSEESVIKAFDELIKKTTDKKKKAELELAKGEFIWEMKIEADAKAFADAMTKAEKLIEGYELGVELDKLHIPHDFAQSFFDIGITDLPELRLQVMAQYEGLDIGVEEQKEIDETLRKIDELEAEAQQERLKKYVEFTRDVISERGKILLEEAYTLADIDSAFTLTDTLAKNKGLITEDQLRILREAGKTVDDLLSMDLGSLKDLFTVNGVVAISDEQIENLAKYGELLAEQRLLAIEHTRKQTEQETAELDWSLFKESEVFAQVFNDLENASDSLISTALEKLKEFKDVWADMDMEEFSEVLEMIDKLETELALATPGKALSTAKTNLRDAMRGQGDYAITFSEGNQAAQDFSPGAIVGPTDYNEYREALEAELAIREGIVNTRTQELAIAEREYSLTMQNAKATDDEKKAAKEAVDNAKGSLKTAKANRDQVSRTLSLDKQRRDALDGIRGRMEKSVELATDLYDAFKGLAEVFFEEDSIGMIFADMGMQMLNTVMNTIMLQIQLDAATVAATGFGVAMNSAMGIIGWIVMAIQLLTMALTAAFKAHDKNLQNQIDGEVKKVDELRKAYERLEKQLEKAFTASDMGDITRKMNKNLEEQIEHTERMIALEEDKKKSDEDKVQSWKDEIEDMKETMEENMEEAFSNLTGGILDDVLGASRDFVDAWHDAFKETGDGMSGLKDSFKDMLLDMLKQQASLNVMGKYMDDYKKWLNDYIDPENGDDIFTKDEAAEYAARVKETFDNVNMELEGYLGAMDEIADQFETGELSGLQKGIQGITEDQAEVLASYWNSCRYLIANIDTTLADVAANVLGGVNNPNSIISELRKQTTILGEIRSQLASVIRSGGDSTHSGEYIKVFDM